MARKAPSGRASERRANGYGWVPDLPDHRDFLYSALKPVPPALPPKTDLRPSCPPVENQGKLNSCTANALVGALEYLERKDRVKFVNLSRLFLYYNERAMEHDIRSDSGAALRDGMKSLANQGVCTETEWPYVVSKFAVRPSARCYRDARKDVIRTYHRILTVDEMRTCLADGFPFVFGFSVYESFESAQVAKTGILNMPGPNERAVGGHAVVAVGYDDAPRRFLIRNSWGAGWGMAGYFTMPYAYLADRNLSDDFWTIRGGGGV